MKKSWASLLPIILMLVFVALTNRHWNSFNLPGYWQGPFNIISFAYLSRLILFAFLNKTYNYRRTNKLNTCVVIPIFNEDSATFLKVLESLDKQTLKPTSIHIVDDHSNDKDCKKVFDRWKVSATIPAVYTYMKINQGKREVQAIAFRKNKSADIFVTIDSDTVLDPRAIKNGLRPFGDPRVMSVAGLLVGLNSGQNLLTRLVDLGFVQSFINGRAAWSYLKTVTVNCGGLAFYRSQVVHKHLNEYLSQTVFGKVARSGDDRILTNFALLEGWAVFQESSIGYTLLPDNFHHLVRQRLRWWRSFFWGGYWLIRRFPINRLVWWLVLSQFISFVFYTLIIGPVFFVLATTGKIPWGFIVYLTLVLSYVRASRYLIVKIPKLEPRQQFINFMLAPASSVLHLFLCSMLQYAGLATVHKTGWGTRKNVEVGI